MFEPGTPSGHDCSSGSGHLEVKIGDTVQNLTPGINQGQATHMWFTYAVKATDRDFDGISIADNALKGCYRFRSGTSPDFLPNQINPHVAGLVGNLPVIGTLDTARLTVTATGSRGDIDVNTPGLQVLEGDTVTFDPPGHRRNRQQKHQPGGIPSAGRPRLRQRH